MQPRLYAPFVLLAVFLLCQCSTKHQPIVFEPYFSLLPEDYLSVPLFAQIKTLEEKEEPTLLEKKRLYDLYILEARVLKSGSPRFLAIAERAEKLKSEIEPIQLEVGKVRSEVLASVQLENGRVQIENPALRKEWQQAYQAWNKDDNDRALRKVEQILRNKDLRALASSQEWVRILNLRFRIALDLFQRQTMDEAYTALKEFAECAPETAQAGFSVSLFAFAEGNSAKALKIFQDQCDKDDSYTNRLKRAYWNFRFQQKDKEAGDRAFLEMNEIPAPGYYAYLARVVRNENMRIHFSPERKPAYLQSDWGVKREVHELFLAAEERLRLGMRRDVSAYVAKAVLLSKNDPQENLFPLLYAAHLFRACGNHLESMRIFTYLSSGLKMEDKESWMELENEILHLFPRPFGHIVDGSAKDWDVDADFVYAIMRQESAFNPGANSSADAKGLMQMMPFLGKALTTQWKSGKLFQDRSLFNGEENIKLATFHLHQLKTLAPHMALMAAAYNAGINRVNTWWKRFGNLPLDVFIELIPINETKNYVKLVLRNFLYYRALRSNGVLEPNLISLALPPFTLSDSGHKTNLTP